ncbi:hypothetical protein [Paenibacillus sp. N3.4]|uniref:hypothetical protein n=1 Tax=Paenibacillus sp. N3.4 TaxID=2603222 RepID=UPI001C9BCE42|nr:hypothetical protein [Paenibacillus sp. N3.4]
MNSDEEMKRMFVGAARAGEVWADLTNTRDDHHMKEPSFITRKRRFFCTLTGK